MTDANATNSGAVVAGVDVGMACTKAVILDGSGASRGTGIVQTRGLLTDCASEALAAAAHEAGVEPEGLHAICGTGFAPEAVPHITMTVLDSTCHVLGSQRRLDKRELCLIDIGGHVPRVILAQADGTCREVRAARRCALGISDFLWLSARALDIHPTRLQELASGADSMAAVSSYCSVFANTEVLERLREGRSREDIALGCIQSIVERVCEIGGIAEPAVVTGGVIAYLPSLADAIGERVGFTLQALSEPILTAALGAALHALASLNGSADTPDTAGAERMRGES